MPTQSENKNEEDKFVVPSWLDAALIEKALHNGGETQIKVRDVKVVPATVSGDHYASTMYRVKVTFEDGGERSLVVKGSPPGEVFQDWIAQWGVFEREGTMLNEIIPKMEAILEEAAPGKYEPFAARCPKWGKKPDFIVLEDLRVSNFQLADRKHGLGLRHSLLALRSLARFHAASHALLRREPELKDKLTVLWQKTSNYTRNFVESGVQKAADACRQWPGYEHYADLLEKYKMICMKTVMELPVPKPGGFHVITHGDFWVNNMMVRYAHGELIGYRMVDLQLAAVSSPAIDLHYFLSTSVSENVSIHYEDLLLREYYHTLRETLEELGIEAPRFEAFEAEIDSHGPYALWGTLNIIPIVKAEETPNLEDAAVGKHDSISYLYESPFVKRWMQRVLPEYVRKGWIPTP